ncbi:MAG: sensor histidine kinase [Oscillospiraceae bacterium]
MVILTAAVVILCLILIKYIFDLKHEMRSIKKELRLSRDKGYDRQLTISLFDKDLTDLAAEMNKNLDFQKHMKFRSEQKERILKQSVSDIAHDLRTPLTVIDGNLQLVASDSSLSEKSGSYVRICRNKTDELRSIADDFFELSVLESEDAAAAKQRIDATEALLSFLADNEGIITSHSLEPQVNFPEKSIFIDADPQMLSRMMNNLLNNVIKYAKGIFFAGISSENGRCVITFANEVDLSCHFDTDRLFDRTYRGDKARHGGGAGLGLYIVKLLADKQGAEVKAVRENRLLSLHIIFDEKTDT